VVRLLADRLGAAAAGARVLPTGSRGCALAGGPDVLGRLHASAAAGWVAWAIWSPFLLCFWGFSPTGASAGPAAGWRSDTGWNECL